MKIVHTILPAMAVTVGLNAGGDVVLDLPCDADLSNLSGQGNQGALSDEEATTLDTSSAYAVVSEPATAGLLVFGLFLSRIFRRLT